MEHVAEDLDRMAPTEFASFQRLDDGPLAVGDEYVVRMPGPWDGPVRAVEVTPTSFRLATLDGHLEAGQIEFRARAGHRSSVFEIESESAAATGSPTPCTRTRWPRRSSCTWISVLGKVVDPPAARWRVTVTTRRIATHRLEGASEASRPAHAAAAGGPRLDTGQLRHLEDRRVHAGARLARGRHDRAAAR